MTLIVGSRMLITGAASGIGKEMVGMALEKGVADLCLVDINANGLESIMEDFHDLSDRLHPYEVDLTDLEQINWLSDDLHKHDLAPDILINNAGMVVGKEFHEHSAEEISKTIGLNTTAMMQLTRLLLPDMMRKHSGHIVNVSSASALIPNKKMSVYAASKWAVLGWSESLRLELQDDNPRIRVTTVLPSYIKTGMFDGVKSMPMVPLLDPKDIAAKILEAIERNQIMLMAPKMVKAIPILKGLLPKQTFDFVADKVFGVYSSMSDFKGRTNETEK